MQRLRSSPQPRRWGGLATRGLVVLCGGRQGVMEAVCRGATAAGGTAVGLTPDPDPDLANRYASIVLATGIGEARNAIIARAFAASSRSATATARCRRSRSACISASA